MDLQLRGKIALVTGSSRGIGKEIATTLFNEGCKIVLNGTDSILLKKTAESFDKSIKYFAMDVTKPKQCSNLIKKIIFVIRHYLYYIRYLDIES